MILTIVIKVIKKPTNTAFFFSGKKMTPDMFTYNLKFFNFVQEKYEKSLAKLLDIKYNISKLWPILNTTVAEVAKNILNAMDLQIKSPSRPTSSTQKNTNKKKKNPQRKSNRKKTK